MYNVTGSAGSYLAQDATRTGDRTSGTAVVISISPALTSSDWQVGDNIDGNGIPACTTIKSIDSATQITLSKNATSNNNGTLTVPERSSSRPGGSTDPYYAPSYLSVTAGQQYPARGGFPSSDALINTCVNGGGGVVVLIW